VSDGIPETDIFYNPANDCYGFSTRFPGQPPHHTIDTFNSVEEVLRWCDPHRERIWEEARDADETKLLISRDFKENGRMAHGTLDARGVIRSTLALIPFADRPLSKDRTASHLAFAYNADTAGVSSDLPAAGAAARC